MTPCPWCGAAFPAATRGGQAKRFCRPACRNAFHAAARRWVHRALAAGLLSVADLKSGSVSPCTPPAPAVSPCPATRHAKAAP